ncbi:hypothetical protein, partial [Xanthomonas campestris]
MFPLEKIHRKPLETVAIQKKRGHKFTWYSVPGVTQARAFGEMLFSTGSHWQVIEIGGLGFIGSLVNRYHVANTILSL